MSHVRSAQNEKHVHVHEFLEFSPHDVDASPTTLVERRTHLSKLCGLDRMRQTRVQWRLFILAYSRRYIPLPLRRHLFKRMFLMNDISSGDVSSLRTQARTTYRSSTLGSHRPQILFPLVASQRLNSAREGHLSRFASAPRTLAAPWIERGSVGDIDGNMTVGSTRISAFGYTGVNLVSACTLAPNVVVLSVPKGRGNRNEGRTIQCKRPSAPYRRCCAL